MKERSRHAAEAELRDQAERLAVFEADPIRGAAIKLFEESLVVVIPRFKAYAIESETLRCEASYRLLVDLTREGHGVTLHFQVFPPPFSRSAFLALPVSAAAGPPAMR